MSAPREAPASTVEANPMSGPDLSLTNNQLSWMRTELSNVRTLLAWARTSVSMIGFGFTIYNFYRGFLDDLLESGQQDAAKNLGLALVGAGTLTILVGIWNYWSINRALLEMDSELQIPPHFKRRWLFSYALSGLLTLIGLVTLLFMLRVI
jgi:putative membrane protein